MKKTMKNHMKNNRGFTLLEIIIAIAIIALMAGTITPLVFKEIQRAKEDATLSELGAIKVGLQDFFADTGRFPTEGEGLTAMVTDPGLNGWSGPYVGGGSRNPITEVTTDAFGSLYQYDLAPTTNPAGAADALIASAGSDLQMTFGAVGGTWTLAAAGDDLLVLVSAGSLNREKILTTQTRMEAIGRAVRLYFQDNATFPATLNDLVDDYLDLGMESSALTDAWNFTFGLSDDAGAPPTLTILSRGPNQVDNSGGADDLVLQISSIPPGRTTTLNRLEIAQTALNSDPMATLTGVWSTDLATLSLSSVFATDGWGQPFEINTASRVIYSSGPDNDGSTVTDNLPKGVGP